MIMAMIFGMIIVLFIFISLLIGTLSSIVIYLFFSLNKTRNETKERWTQFVKKPFVKTIFLNNETNKT